MSARAEQFRVEVALDTAATLGEGPVWDERSQTLVWVDILEHTVHRFDPVSGTDRHRRLQAPVGAAVPRTQGGLVLALGLGFAILEEPSGAVTEIATVGRGDRMNDGACDPAGRFLAGTMVDEHTPGAAALYVLEPDGTVRTAMEQVTLSNGLAWSSDGGHLYYVDTPLERIDVFDYDVSAGALSDRRIAVDLADVPGRPDGLTIDAAGNLWVAMARGAQVRCYQPDGVLVHAIDVPAPLVTSLAFGGSDLSELYVTTGRWAASAADLELHPHAGALFRICGLGIHGLTAHRYAG